MHYVKCIKLLVRMCYIACFLQIKWEEVNCTYFENVINASDILLKKLLLHGICMRLVYMQHMSC